MIPLSKTLPLLAFCDDSSLGIIYPTATRSARRGPRLASTNLAALVPFDFSSKKGWDDFYTERESNEGTETFEYEWHPSIPHSSIISQIAPGSSCLMLGCGNSALPSALYDSHQRGNGSAAGTRVCCLDYSSVCVDAMRELHGRGRPGMTFLCADALKMDAMDRADLVGDAEAEEGALFDVVVDKGLIDALMCGEAWDYDVSRLFRGVSDILRRDGGTYILISFKLAQSTKDFIRDECNNYGFEWEFDIESKSNDRVSFSLGRRKAPH